MRINYNKLYYFYEVARSLSLTAAAERLYISQPSLSKAMKDLQESFDTQLFVRHGRHLHLTPAGEALKQECDTLFGHEDALLARVWAAGNQGMEDIRFGYVVFNELYRMGHILRRFESLNPRCQIHSRRYFERNDITRELLQGELDLGLKIFTADEMLPELDHVTLKECHLTLVVPADHWAVGRQSVNISELKNEPFVMQGSGDHSTEFSFARNWCRQHGFEPRIASASDRVETVMMRVQSGEGVAILSELAPLEQMSGLCSIPIENSMVIGSGLFWNRSCATPATHRLVQFYLSQIKDINPHHAVP